MLKISDTHWDRIKRHVPEENIPDGGRKPVPTRQVLDAVLWILNTGAQWKMLPQSYPNYTTVHRRFQAWAQQEILRGIWPMSCASRTCWIPRNATSMPRSPMVAAAGWK